MLHLDSDKWKHFILNTLCLVGGDATHSFISILLLHVLHTLDHNCTCQNNPRLGFGMFGNLHAFSSISVQVVVWEAFLFLLTHHHLVHVCVHFIDHLTHHHSSQKSFHHVGGDVGNLPSSSSHTPPSAHIIPYHSLSFITTFIPMSHVPSSTQSYKHLSSSGVGLYWFT